MCSVGFVIARASAYSPRYILKTKFRCPVLFCETIISPCTLTLPTSWHYRSVRQRWPLEIILDLKVTFDAVLLKGCHHVAD